ncbi:MAG TPA: alpha/beta hydrolase [Dehalococcoidia bacterium]|nr:alpha/beta hydrolase [Dehalococcoidia bacterium]
MNQPTEVDIPAGVELVRDVEFGTGGGRPLKLHIVRAENREPGARTPAIVYVHGGFWRAGSKETGLERLIPLAQRGYFCVAVEYRLVQESIWPAQIEDCKLAVRWLRAHAGEYGIDRERIGVWGASAGGHLAAMLGAAGDAAQLEGNGGWSDQPSQVQAVVDQFGIADLLTMGKNNIDHDAPDAPGSMLIGGPVQENKAAAAAASPVSYLTSNCPPFLILHGTADVIVNVGQGKQLHAAMQAAGLDSTLQLFEGKGHEDLGDESRRMVYAFFDKHLKG